MRFILNSHFVLQKKHQLIYTFLHSVPLSWKDGAMVRVVQYNYTVAQSSQDQDLRIISTALYTASQTQ